MSPDPNVLPSDDLTILPTVLDSCGLYRDVAAIGGVDTSEHCDGRAADIICPAYGSPYQVAQAIYAAGIEFNQLILEYGAWVHISIPKCGRGPKMETLTYRKGRATVRGLVS